jgi:molecular chaperone GrpE
MRRRQQQEADESRRRIIEGFTQELLPVVDSFQLALQAGAEGGPAAEIGALLDGVRLVQSLLVAALERHGLQEIVAQDRPFDPARHEAVAVEPRADVPPGRVLKVLQAGYLLGDRVLRHAKVLVSGAPPVRPS